MPRGIDVHLRNTTVLISGGGIAGSALAYWLRRYGFAPTVVERAPGVRTGGHRIEMAGGGCEVLHRMGVLERVRAAGGPPPKTTLFLGDRNRPVHISLGNDTPGTPPERAPFTIKRGALCEILHEHVQDGVEYIFDDSITGIRQTRDGVRVAFENSEPRRVDLLIGADGLHSNVRSRVFGDRERFTRYLGTNLAIFTVDNYLGVHDSSMFHVWPYRGCAITNFPGNTELEGLFLIRSKVPLDVRDLTREERMGLVERIYADDGWEVPGLLRAMRGSRDFHFAPSTQIRMDSWSDGRVVLLGDAGYCPDPMTGQGSGLALVGAYILAGELKAARGDHTSALPAYEAAMRDFVAAGQRIGGLSTSFAAPRAGRAGVWMNEQLMRAVLSLLPLSERLGLGLSAREAPNAVTLKDYEPAR